LGYATIVMKFVFMATNAPLVVFCFWLVRKTHQNTWWLTMVAPLI